MPEVYGKVTAKVTASPNSDFTEPFFNVSLDPYSPNDIPTFVNDGAESTQLQIGTVLETIDLARWNFINLFVVKNLDPTNYVTVSVRSQANTDNSDAGTVVTRQRLQPNGIMVLTDVLPANDVTMQANGANCSVKMIIVGDS